MQISVVIPTYNRWPVIARAVDSVLDQSYPAAEILIVDDGSTDNTGNKLRKQFGRRITVIEQTNRGVSNARNQAINHADGDWVALLDSDDEWLPQKLERQCEAITASDNAILVHSNEIWIRNGVRVNAAKKHEKRGGYIYQHCLPLCCISPSAALIKKDALEQLGGFDENLPACEDYDLWLRLCCRYPVTYVDEPLLRKYGGHEDQLSAKYWGMDRFRIIALEKILKSDSLSADQRKITIEALLQKTRIMLIGAKKHNNISMISYCSSLVAHYS